MHNDENEITSTLNICSGTAHPVLRHFNRTMFAQSMSILLLSNTKGETRNLAKPNGSFSIASSNVKENTWTLDKAFRECFREHLLLSDATKIIKRSSANKVIQI